MAKKTSTDPYKGVRDFYPEDMRVERYMRAIWRHTAESFGYSEYDASILEPAELYESKSSEEIVNEQTYTFEDRGKRRVTLRPEMTPTVARMIAARRKSLSFPLRWYSIPNLFRYEQPQRGRLREHVQLNVDLFGVESLEAETEVILLAYALMKNFGAKDEHFYIKINSRKVVNELYKIFKVSKEQEGQLSRILDKKDKVPPEEFQASVRYVLGKETERFLETISSNPEVINTLSEEHEGIRDVIGLIETFDALGIKNVVFDPLLVRGFDYYTGVVFEIFDTNPNNRRALFGGGRYDDLLSVFNSEPVPSFGFGMGNVTLKDFLETRELLPHPIPAADLYICRLEPAFSSDIQRLAARLRKEDVRVAVDLTERKLKQQIQYADKEGIPFIICVGENEITSGRYTLKHLPTGEEMELSQEELSAHIKKYQPPVL